MGKVTVLALRGVLALLLAGSVFVQTVMMVLLAEDLKELDAAFAHLRVPILVTIVLGIVTAQVVLVCLWRLVTMVGRGTVFSHASFRYVNVIIGALVAAAAVTFVFAVIVAGTDVAPGVVLLICGVVVAILGVALTVLMLRMLLAQAVARDAEAAELQAELEDVI